jgi:hypothetical protein
VTWYLWFIVGLVGGIVLSVAFIIAGTYVIMHSPTLQQRVMSRTMRSVMNGHKATAPSSIGKP